ncbi:hypothetical protein B0T40_05890 [Chromobacterium haemolyticum]|nr:hypothetical protein B0T40_05890 [Chromobacterium haemolyticum]
MQSRTSAAWRPTSANAGAQPQKAPPAKDSEPHNSPAACSAPGSTTPAISFNSASFLDAACCWLGQAVFDAPWVVEGGVHRTLSNPGSVSSMQGYGAVTYGRDRWRLITLAINAGGEGYMPIGVNQPKQSFDSQLYQLSWREWIGTHWGIHAAVERYHSPYYERTGITTAVFWNLP